MNEDNLNKMISAAIKAYGDARTTRFFELVKAIQDFSREFLSEEPVTVSLPGTMFDQLVAWANSKSQDPYPISDITTIKFYGCVEFRRKAE